MNIPSRPRVLSIAGSDPSGGAGIQADLKSIAAHGGYGMAAIAALTAQNTQGVSAVHTPDASFLRKQLDALSADVAIDAVKIGMLGSAAVVAEVAAWLSEHRPALVVLDPVLVATSGDRLLDADAETALRQLCRLADVVTPNLAELAVLAGTAEAASWDDALAQAKAVSRVFGTAVVVKGGHLAGDSCPDALVDVSAEPVVQELTAPRIHSTNTHGTGCSLSSALATLVPQSDSVFEALRIAKDWLSRAISAGEALQVGHGHGPVDHLVDVVSPHTGSGAPENGHRGHEVLDGDAAPILAQWWADITDVMEGIDQLTFIRTLSEGTLDETLFRNCLGQDALYLREYARLLARASQLAPTREEQVFWAKASQASLVSEMQLHDSWIQQEPGHQSPETKGYLDHLAASTENYGVALAALLPCFWIYQDVGIRLAASNHSSHPYEAWLSTYADEGFSQETREAITFTEAAARAADDATRAAMWRAFRASSEHELAFFAQVPQGY